MSTHVMEIAELLCDRIGIIQHGELIALSILSELNQQVSLKVSILEDIFFELTCDYNADTIKLLDELEARLKFYRTFPFSS